MQRSKQQALMFLLGAMLVGGALGFSAKTYMGHEKFAGQYGPRARFFDEIGLTPQQRATIDSLTFRQDCAMKAVLAPHDSVLKAIRASFKAQWRQVFTKEQLAKYDARDKEIQAHREAERQKEPKRTCSGN
jgi:Spy/CpxP family protein refolding chaperone